MDGPVGGNSRRCDARAVTTPIPHVDTVDDPFHSTDDLRERWRALLGPLGFSESLLWVKPVFDDITLSRFTLQIEQDMAPSPTLADLLMLRLSDLMDHDDEIVGWALLLTRPGDDNLSSWDQGWTRALTLAAASLDVPIEPVFRANCRDVREVVADSDGGS